MSRLWVSPYNDKERQTIHDDNAVAAEQELGNGIIHRPLGAVKNARLKAMSVCTDEE